MPHLIETIRDASIGRSIVLLEEAHSLIVSAVTASEKKILGSQAGWGCNLKRLDVKLPVHKIIGKSSEKFVEIINILATTERIISALKWFDGVYPGCSVRECHASTSDDPGGNDIVLVDKDSKVSVRCEVTDVLSNRAGQNGKETKDLKNLGCESEVPADHVERFIATSSEFSQALSSSKRNWASKHFRYEAHETEMADKTVLLKILKPI